MGTNEAMALTHNLMVTNEATTLNHNHSLFLHASDTCNIVLISIKLTGPENYALYSKLMKLALRGKENLEFIVGSCAKTVYREALEE